MVALTTVAIAVLVVALTVRLVRSRTTSPQAPPHGFQQLLFTRYRPLSSPAYIIYADISQGRSESPIPCELMATTSSIGLRRGCQCRRSKISLHLRYERTPCQRASLSLRRSPGLSFLIFHSLGGYGQSLGALHRYSVSLHTHDIHRVPLPETRCRSVIGPPPHIVLEHSPITLCVRSYQLAERCSPRCT